LYKIPANTLFIGQKLIYVPECHSTNTLLNELNEKSELPEGSLLITDNQTAGRGQRGNSWQAEAGKNLTFSILLKPKFLEPRLQFQLNMMVSLSLAEAISSLTSLVIKLKWPNDLFAGDKKVGGILIESQLQGSTLFSSIIGIGLNVNQERFDHPGAASLASITHQTHDLETVLDRALEILEHTYLELRSGRLHGIKRRYLDSLYRYYHPHRFFSNGKEFSGIIRDVDENGKLCVETGEGVRTFAFKEIGFVID
jgi:BirA family biotin operon repressor/biotin-[acetyl-CoA-carboxylase] ligase